MTPAEIQDLLTQCAQALRDYTLDHADTLTLRNVMGRCECGCCERARALLAQLADAGISG